MTGESPSRLPKPPSEDDDFAMADTPLLGKLAAAAVAAAGAMTFLTGLQAFFAGLGWFGSLVRSPAFRLFAEYAPYALMGLGLGLLATGAMLYRAKMWALGAGLGGSAAMALLTGGTLLVQLVGAAFSCMTLAAFPLSALATLLTAISVPGVRRTAAARRRLEERGMGLGL